MNRIAWLIKTATLIGLASYRSIWNEEQGRNIICQVLYAKRTLGFGVSPALVFRSTKIRVHRKAN